MPPIGTDEEPANSHQTVKNSQPDEQGIVRRHVPQDEDQEGTRDDVGKNNNDKGWAKQDANMLRLDFSAERLVI